MSIIRVRKDARYFTASNEPFIDKRLSWETRGLMGYLLTKPDNWQVRIEDLQKQGPAKLHKLRRMLAEARLYGYMNRTRLSLPDGTFDWLTEVFESPTQNPNPSSSIRKSNTGQSRVGLSTGGSSTSGKPADIVTTDPENTESPAATPRPPKANQIPEVLLFRSVTRAYPPHATFGTVVKAVRAVSARLRRPVTRDDLFPFFEAWCERYKPTNMAWLTEWAVSGVIPARNGNGHKPAPVQRLTDQQLEESRRAAEKEFQS